MSTPSALTWDGFVEPTFGQRFLARFADGLLVGLSSLPLALVAHGDVRRSLLIALGAIYEIGMMAWRGQTLGKIALGIRVADIGTGDVPALSQAVLRWMGIGGADLVIHLLSPDSFETLALGAYALADLGLILRRPLHRALHDYLAGTVVTAVPEPGRRG